MDGGKNIEEVEQDPPLVKGKPKAKKKREKEVKRKKVINWGYDKGEKIFKLKHLRFKPFTTAVTEEEKYEEAVALTGNLYGRQFIERLSEGKWRMRYYEKPFPEYCVQGQFLDRISCIEMVDVDENYDQIYHIVENEDVFGHIKIMRLRNCNVMAEQLKVLCPMLWSAYVLNELDLSHNPVGDEGLNVILKNLHDCASLRSLNLFDTQITPLGLEKFAHAYSKHQLPIIKLNIGKNSLNNPIIIKQFLGRVVKRSPLEVLLMANCTFQGAEVAANIETTLSLSGHLRYLDISFNLFSTEEELSSIMNLFARSISLRDMILNFNPIRDNVLTGMLDCLFEFPRLEPHKSLYIENITVPQVYFKEKWNSFNRKDLKITTGGVRKIEIPKFDSFKYKLVKRFNFLYKKKKPKKDVVISTLQENLPKNLKRIKVDDFKDTLMMIGKIDVLLIQEIANEFAGGGPRANVQEFIDIYNELYPPKPKIVKKSPLVKKNIKKVIKK